LFTHTCVPRLTHAPHRNKLVKDTATHQNPNDLIPLRVLSNTLLRSGRRTKRSALELSAAVMPLIRHHRLCHYTKQALCDRRDSLKTKITAIRTVEAKTIKVNTARSQGGDAETVAKAEMELDVCRQVLKQRQADARDVGETLTAEVERIGKERRVEYVNALKVCASSFAQSASENLAIWEKAKQQLDNELGELGLSLN